MDKDEMQQRMLKCIRSTPSGVTFIDLMDALGPEARGAERVSHIFTNSVLWEGVSSMFAAALRALMPMLTIEVVKPSDYSQRLHYPASSQIQAHVTRRWIPSRLKYRSSARLKSKGTRYRRAKVESGRREASVRINTQHSPSPPTSVDAISYAWSKLNSRTAIPNALTMSLHAYGQRFR